MKMTLSANNRLSRRVFLLAALVATACLTGRAQRFTIEQTLSDEAQRTTIAFDGLAFLAGSLGSDSFFPPGKVADFWGFQYLRDNDPTEMGHNTGFLTSAAFNMLTVLTPGERQALITLAESQVDAINDYGYDRFVLMKAFRRLLEGDVPAGSTGLDRIAVRTYSSELYRLDGRISFERARVMGGLLHGLAPAQKSYLDSMVGKGMLDWPAATEPPELRGLNRDVKVAVMTYAGDMFSWYAGSVEADVYFCPERQGTYFGSFYMKDAPAVGNPNYTIDPNLTADYGRYFLEVLTPAESLLIAALVDIQRPSLYEIVDRREDVSTELRKFIAGIDADSALVDSLMGRYGELDGEIVYRFATHFAEVNGMIDSVQRDSLATLRHEVLGDFNPSGAFLYAEPIPIPNIPNTDFLFHVPAAHERVYTTRAGWNLVSIPQENNVALAWELFPTAISGVYAYPGAYERRDSLTCGIGYWVKYLTAEDVTVTGEELLCDTISLRAGWNIVGGPGVPFAAAGVVSDSPGVVLGGFYGYDGSYVTADTLRPFRGYWVKSDKACRLMMDASGALSGAYTVRIVDDGENPPEPPADSDAPAGGIPGSYALLQNYPNPFNPATTIEFRLPVESRVVLTVSNALGQVVAVLIDGIVPAGPGSAVWTAAGMPSGLYFCRIEAAGVADPSRVFTEARKMVIVK